MSFWCFFGLFFAKSLILGTLTTFKKFSCAPLNLFNQDASFKYSYVYIWSDSFFDQKSGIGRDSKKIVNIVWITYFCIRLYSFSDLMNIQKVENFRFLDACNRPGDFGHTNLTNYLKFIEQRKLWLSSMYCPQLNFFRGFCRKNWRVSKRDRKIRKNTCFNLNYNIYWFLDDNFFFCYQEQTS